ncbi:M1 family metallopeptidase [Moheibacter lacus]|uniref:M1 family metallopeptidase n=1 Tax=Moheibacter lacus TaxID=2745851 RepID=A0A838ZN74_9FLAO|nr:M1 family metallopeptidase [Moheibacter lacus]MBA5629106.1 M1 family metallopeptidase [Moheibacter lacus]
MKNRFCFLLLQLLWMPLWAQENSWQQRVDYDMEIDVDHAKFQYDGKMKLEYTNHSPDQLDKVYFHLYYNAFQPGSAMDARLTNIKDPDGRMVIKEADGTIKSRIAALTDENIGFQKISSLKQNGKNLSYKVSGTILEVQLVDALKPGAKATFDMIWKAQVPELIRRGGRNSKEGVDFSMTQWYPKMAQYDAFGWHLDEYVGREFIAPFGDFDIKIKIQKDYVIGASGKLMNQDAVKGYSEKGNTKTASLKNSDKVIWQFHAENIHDFAWAADKEFLVTKQKAVDGPEIYFVRMNDETTAKNWKEAEVPTVQFFEYMRRNFGKYPWETYTIVQGGDGGMEYGTVTLITGKRSFESLVGVIYHEAAHSWFQHLFGINETVDEWMDEGFTSYAEHLAYLEIFKKPVEPNPNYAAYEGYFALAKSGYEEPMSLLADYYDTNYAYGVQAYVKGQVYLIQLEYIIGKENLKKTFSEFYKNWKFKHPTPNDFRRTAEKVSGLNLKWYENLFVNTTRTVDYSIENLSDTTIELKNLSNFPMPIDLLVEYADGSKELFYIPNLELRGEKPAEDFELYKNAKRTILEPWIWTNPNYTVKISKAVKRVTIDPTLRLADLNYSNNIYSK